MPTDNSYACGKKNQDAGKPVFSRIQYRSPDILIIWLSIILPLQDIQLIIDAPDVSSYTHVQTDMPFKDIARYSSAAGAAAAVGIACHARGYNESLAHGI